MSGRTRRRPTAAALVADLQTLRQGILERGLKLGEGVDRSGRPCAWLLDCREVLLDSRYLPLAARLLWDRLRPYRPQMVGGGGLGAAPLVAALLCEAAADGQRLEGFLVRPEPHGRGLCKRIEGSPIGPGARVVLVDDLLNSGRSLIALLRSLEPLRPELLAVAVLVDHQRAGSGWLAARDVPLEALFTLADLGIAPTTTQPMLVPGAAQVTLAPGCSPSHVPNAAHLPLLWSWEPLNLSTYSAPRSAPCLSDGRIVVGSDCGFLLGLDLEGRERWRFVARHSEHGILSSPLVVDGAAYVGAYDGRVYCVDLQDGSLLWERRVGRWIGSSPTCDRARGLLFIGVEHAGGRGGVAALSLATGEVAWGCELPGYVHSSPWYDVSRDALIVGCNDGYVYSLDARAEAGGALRWRFAAGGAVKGRPVVDGDGTCYVGSFDGVLYALDVASGAPRWQRRLARRLYTWPLLYRDLVIVGGSSGHLVALERSTGRLRWIAATAGAIVGGAALVAERFVAVGAAGGAISLFDVRDGSLVWGYQTDGPIRTTPGIGGDLLLVPSGDGRLYAFSTQPLAEDPAQPSP